MKESIISLNDTLATLMVLAISLLGVVFGVGYGGGIWIGLFGFAGFVIGSLLSGLWFVLSGIYQQLKNANHQLLEANQQLKQIQSGTSGANAELDEIKRLIAGPSA